MNEELKLAIASFEMAKAKSLEATAKWLEARAVLKAASEVAAEAASEVDAARKVLLNVLGA